VPHLVCFTDAGVPEPVDWGALGGWGVGRRLGAAVTRAVGAKDGGPALGRAVGNWEGFVDGVALGDWDNTTVGLALGAATGESAGTADGTEVELVKG
jgi:hypothetical protein